MDIKKTLETAAQLFLTSFNGEIFEHGALEIVATVGVPSGARWFRQSFSDPANFELFAGISGEAAAVIPGELVELLGNVFRVMANALSAGCGVLIEDTPADGLENITYELRSESILRGRVFLVFRVSDPVVEARPAARHLDALMNVDLPVTISFGTTEMLLADILKLTTGSIVEFNHRLDEPVNIVVNECLVARGDVVVVDANYGVRITEVLNVSG
jgi:flagellar motor switch protein FliN